MLGSIYTGTQMLRTLVKVKDVPPERTTLEFVAKEWTAPFHHPSCLPSSPAVVPVSRREHTKNHISTALLR